MRTVGTVVVGGGQAGLAAGFHLRRRGENFVVLDANAVPGGSWGSYYESLVLFSPARRSSLPGMPFPGDPARYPVRDDVVAYLAAYAERWDLPVLHGHRVTSVVAVDGGFEVRAADGSWRAHRVVNATGGFGAPVRPALPGLGEFGGEVLHSSEYRTPESFDGRRVVVVGGGNSAVQIAVEIAARATVTLASRRPVRLAPQRPGGVDLHDWLVRSGVDRVPAGLWPSRSRTVPVIDDGRYRAALAAGRPERRPMFSRLTEEGVRWADGTDEPIDVIVLATGFRPDLAHLSGVPGALAADGSPHHRGGLSAVRGLGHVGLEWQRSFGSATLRGAGRDAAHVTRRLLAPGAPVGAP